MQMQSLPLLARLAPGALVAPGLIFLGLVRQGADAITQGLLFSFLLLVVTAFSVALAPRRLLAHAIRTNELSAVAAFGLIAYSVAAAAPLTPSLAAVLAQPMPTAADAMPAISVAPTSTLLAALINLAPLAAFGLGSLTGTSERSRALAVRVMIAAAMVLAAYALFDFRFAREVRLDVNLPSSNAAAVLFGALAILALALMMRAMRRSLATPSQSRTLPQSLAGAYAIINAPLSTAAIVLALLCLVLTGSRGGAIVTALGVAAFLAAILASRRERSTTVRLTRLAIWGVAVALAALATYAAAPLLSRLDAGVSSIAGRAQLAAAHWGVFLKSPWFGHGSGSYHSANLSAMTPENFEALRNAGAAHNIYLQALEEVGVIGVALLALALATPLWRASQAFAARPAAPEWKSAALAMSVVLLTQGAFDFALQIPALAALYAYCLALLTQPRAPVGSVVPADARAGRDA
jgi:O-antigen ligase